MGYWDYELFENDATLDWVDSVSERLCKRMIDVSYSSQASTFYNAAIWFRGNMAVVADTKRKEVPLSVIKVAHVFYKNVDNLIALLDDENFKNVLYREKRNIEWFLASDMGLISLENIGGVRALY